MTTFFLIRHGTIDSSGKALAGRMAGVHLNERGRQQAEALARKLATSGIDAIYSSPLERAVETAGPLARALGLELALEQSLVEIDFGDWTNRSFVELSADSGFQRFNKFRSMAPVPGGEFMLQAQARMVIGLDELRRRHPHATVAVVSHGDPIRAAVAWYAGIPLDLFQRIEISLASVSVVEIDDDAIRILSINTTENPEAIRAQCD
ncbi:MAG: histidine phosphatase family protein [Pseudomonadota bacterium]|nr:histidine phosphatase family protein [Pseudomonadota bacterium]